MTRSQGLLVIGGSAGALEPLFQIVAALPDAFTRPIAVVLHMLATQPSALAELLAHHTLRRVRAAEDKEPLAPGTIYVASPDYHLLIERAGTLALSMDEPVHFSRPSIDVLFESAAEAFGGRTIGVLLSGANADGAAGLRRIADAGGVTFVQSPGSAAYPLMPLAGLRAVPHARPCEPAEMARAIADVRVVTA